jgi:hypothetical protein
MPTSTYVPLASIQLSSPTSVVSFTSIPQTYKEIVFSISAYCTTSSQTFSMYWNNDTSGNYFYGITAGSGGSRSHSEQNSSSMLLWLNTSIPSWDADNSSYEISIPDYAQSTRNKTFIGQGFTQFHSAMSTGVYYSTAAISSVYFKVGGGNFATGSTFNLWGIDG